MHLEKAPIIELFLVPYIVSGERGTFSVLFTNLASGTSCLSPLSVQAR